MRQDNVKQAQEKRKLAALIKKYAAWLDEPSSRELFRYASNIEGEADRLEQSTGECGVAPMGKRDGHRPFKRP